MTRSLAGHGAAYLTRAEIAAGLRRLGLDQGQSVLVHSSLSSLGNVEGGAPALAGALFDVLGPQGTVVVLTSTAGNSDTSRAYLTATRGMSAAERHRYRARMPAFDPAVTPSTGMGVLAEHIRTSPGALRSLHPQTSFAAKGALAEAFIDGHAPDCHLGESSPLARLYDVGADILMIGTGYETCTAFHLAEYRYTADPPTRRYNCVIERDGRPVWWSYEDVALDDSDFCQIGKILDSTPYVTRENIGHAPCRRVPLRQAVDFACGWLRNHRNPLKSGRGH